VWHRSNASTETGEQRSTFDGVDEQRPAVQACSESLKQITGTTVDVEQPLRWIVQKGATMKAGWLVFYLYAFSGTITAEQTDGCAGLEGTGLTQCQGNQQTLRQQERLEQLLQQQQERQVQLDKQQREVQEQLESMRLQNESLRKQLEREIANQTARPVATNATAPAPPKSEDIKRWKADNPWFGSDYAKTQFAMRYGKQLQQERPELSGRPLLDALSTKVNETFGERH